MACACREAEWLSRFAAMEAEIVGYQRELVELRATLAQERAARERAESAHAGCDAQVRTLVSKALAAVRGQEAAESRLTAAEECLRHAAREAAEAERDRAAQIANKEAVLASAALSRATYAESRLAAERALRERAEKARDDHFAVRLLAETERDRLRERLDQFEAYAITVASALDERAAREKAERLLAECDDELENASCPPMTNETIPERIARLAGLVSSTARDEQTALEGKVAAESRLAEAEAENARLREACRMVLLFYNTGYWTKANADEWASVTGEIDATTRVLCDTVRRALGPPALAPAAPAKEKEGENG